MYIGKELHIHRITLTRNIARKEQQEKKCLLKFSKFSLIRKELTLGQEAAVEDELQSLWEGHEKSQC